MALGWGDPNIAFTAILELGSIAAVIWYFWGDLVQLAVGAIKAIQTSSYESHEWPIVMGIGLGTLPIVFFGLLLKKFIPDFDHSPLRSLGAIAIASSARSCAASGRSSNCIRGQRARRRADGNARSRRRPRLPSDAEQGPPACLTPHTWHLTPHTDQTRPPFLPGR